MKEWGVGNETLKQMLMRGKGREKGGGYKAMNYRSF